MNTEILNILSENIDEINIIKMIIKDSNEIDLKYDRKIDFENEIIKINQDTKRIKNINKPELLEVCKKYRLKKYKQLNKKELIDKLNIFLINKKKNKIKNHKIDIDFIINTRFHILGLINKSNTISSDNKKEKILFIITLYKYLTENLFFMMIHKEFYNTVIIKMEEFINDINIYYPEKIEEFNKYTKILEEKL